MRYKKRFKTIKTDIEEHVSTISVFSDRGTIPMSNLSALLLRLQAICDGKSLKEAIKIQRNHMNKNKVN
jgi:hypothetical protein